MQELRDTAHEADAGVALPDGRQVPLGRRIRHEGRSVGNQQSETTIERIERT